MDKPLEGGNFVKHTSSFDLSILRKYNIKCYEKTIINSNKRKPKGQSIGNFWWQNFAAQNDEYGYLSWQRDY
jgi:hypothetical protein